VGSDSKVSKIGIDFANAASGLSKYILERSIAIPSCSVYPPQLAIQFRDKLDSGDAIGAMKFAQNLLSWQGTDEEQAAYWQAYRQIMKIMTDLPGMEPYQHFGNPKDLFMAWFLLKKDPHSACEVQMIRIVEQADYNRQAKQEHRSAVGGPMQGAVTEQLVNYLNANPDRAVAEFRIAEFRNRYPFSTDVQEWLDIVEKKLKS